MTVELELYWALRLVELVYPNLFPIGAGKEMASMREDYFATLADWERLVRLDSFIENVE